jgi:hypothetical protein
LGHFFENASGHPVCHASVRRKTRSRCFLSLIECNRKSGWQLSDKTWFGIPPIRSWNRPVKNIWKWDGRKKWHSS